MRINNYVHFYTYPELLSVLENYKVPVPEGVSSGTVLLCTEDEVNTFYNFLLYFGAYSMTDANGTAIWNDIEKVWEYV